MTRKRFTDLMFEATEEAKLIRGLETNRKSDCKKLFKSGGSIKINVNLNINV